MTDLVTQVRNLIEKKPAFPPDPDLEASRMDNAAEFAFMTASLEGIGEHVNALEKTIERAVGAAEVARSRDRGKGGRTRLAQMGAPVRGR